MRRLLASLSALCLFVLVGCTHTCGVCDCDSWHYNCGCTCAGMGYPGVCCPQTGHAAQYAPVGLGAPVVPAEPVKMPKEDKKDKAKDKAPVGE